MPKVVYEAPDIPALTRSHFVADMHFHTAHSYDCNTPVRDVIALARKLGIHVAITDHNRIGGVLESRKFQNAPVIPGVEICTKEGKEVIAYFFDAGQLEDFYNRKIASQIKEKNALRTAKTSIMMERLMADLEEEDCVVHLPHPFGAMPRTSYKFFNNRPWLLRRIDSIEVFNEQLTRRANMAALGWATQLAKGVAGGSDGHGLLRLGKGITTSSATTVEEHLRALKKGRVSVFGTELKPMQLVLNYARTSGKSKLRNGFKGGLRRLRPQRANSFESAR